MSEALTLLAVISSFLMSVSIGASSVSPAFGPVNSSGTLNVLRSALLAGFFAFLGSVVQGGNVSQTVGSGFLSGEIVILQATIILLVSAFLVIFSVLTDYPMPTAFTVVGAVLGSSFAFGNSIMTPVVNKVVAYWVLVPFAAAAMSFVLSLVLKKYLSEDSDKKIKYLLLISGSYMAFTAGAGSVGLAVGPLMSIFDVPALLLLTFGGLAILLGSWIYSPRIIRAVSYDYSNIGPRRSIAALGTSALLAQVGIFYGVPISFNEAIIASVIGSGLVEGVSNTSGSKIFRTIGAWIGAFILSGVLTFVVGYVALLF